MKENHHFVPQFYLRNFSHNEQNISMYMHEKKLFVDGANIKGQAYKKRLYGNTEIIENTLMNMEHRVSIIINKILKSKTLSCLSVDEYHHLLLFITVTDARVTKMADSMSNLIDKFTKYAINSSADLDISAEFIQNLEFGMDVPNIVPIQVAMNGYPALLDLKPLLLISKCDRQFITSDSPVIKYNHFYRKRNYHLGGDGLISRGLQIFFPLTPKMLLLLLDDEVYDYGNADREIIHLDKGKEIDEINRLVFMNSYKSIFYKTSVKQTYISRIIKNCNPIFSTEGEFEIANSNIGEIIAVSHSSINESVNLDSIRIRLPYMNLILPEHMGGLQRPEAKMMLDMMEKRGVDFG